MSGFHSKRITLVGTGGTISVPLSRLAGYRSDGGGGSAVSSFVNRGRQLAGSSGTATEFYYLEDTAPFVEGDCVVKGPPGADVVAYFDFE